MMPIIFKFGPITLYSFGLLGALALLMAAFIVWKEARIRGLNEEKIIDVFVISVIAALFFSRLEYVISHWSFFAPDPGKVFFLWKYPGLALNGAFLGAFLVAVLSSSSLNLSVWEVLDIFSLSLAAAAAFGFFGCFLDHCLVGPLWMPLVPLALAILIVLALTRIQIQFRKSPELSKLGKKAGFIFLSYLIFQSISFLILAVVERSREVLLYSLLALLALIVYIIRYNSLIRLWLNSLAMFLARLKPTSKDGGMTSNGV